MTYESATVCYTNPLITPEMAAEVGKMCFGITYTPCRLTIRGRPNMTAGDVIRAWDSKGEVHNVLVMEQTIVMSAGLKTTVTCPGEVSEDTEFYSSSPSGRETQAVNAATLEQMKVYANAGDANVLAQAKAYADQLFAGGSGVVDGNEVSY